MNVCFHLLDDPVIGGRADDLLMASPERSFARMLEDVAALGGALRAVGVSAGDQVLVDLQPDYEAVLVALAVARLGGVLVTGDLSASTPVVVVTDRLPGVRAALASASYQPGTVLVHGPHDDLDQRQELDWEIALKAGRTDPAPCVEVDPDAAYDATRRVADLVAASDTLVAEPLPASRLRRVLLP